MYIFKLKLSFHLVQISKQALVVEDIKRYKRTKLSLLRKILHRGKKITWNDISGLKLKGKDVNTKNCLWKTDFLKAC